MAEKYVSVSALRELLSIPPDGDCEKCEHHVWYGCYNDELVRACEAIDDATEADVRPVVRGEWIICSDGYYPYCSVCKNEPQGMVMTDFCPNCGADMRGEQE